MPACATTLDVWLEHPELIDLIVVVLSTGGILLMAGYAVLCDRI